MANVIYVLCAVAALVCMVLLFRAYARSGYRLLLWSGLCFAGLTLNNVALVIDKALGPPYDLSIWRTSLALASMCVLLYGLVWNDQ